METEVAHLSVESVALTVLPDEAKVRQFAAWVAAETEADKRFCYAFKGAIWTAVSFTGSVLQIVPLMQRHLELAGAVAACQGDCDALLQERSWTTIVLVCSFVHAAATMLNTTLYSCCCCRDNGVIRTAGRNGRSWQPGWHWKRRIAHGVCTGLGVGALLGSMIELPPSLSSWAFQVGLCSNSCNYTTGNRLKESARFFSCFTLLGGIFSTYYGTLYTFQKYPKTR